MKIKLFIITVLIFTQCSEPYDFELSSQILDIVDAKISDVQGASYVKVFTVADSMRLPKQNLNVRIVSDNGEEFNFIYNGLESYIPEDRSFAAQTGVSYRLEMRSQDGDDYQTEFELMPEPIAFEIFSKDSAIQELSAGSIVSSRSGTVPVARIPQQENGTYAKMQFNLSYVDFFSDQTFEEEFTETYSLYACDKGGGCSAAEVPVGVTFKDRFYFFDDDFEGCELARDTTNVLLYCNLPCCIFKDEWVVEFAVNLESMSFETYTYWSNVERLINNDGLLFDVMPFPIEGNVSCEGCENTVIGLFRAVAETRATTIAVL